MFLSNLSAFLYEYLEALVHVFHQLSVNLSFGLNLFRCNLLLSTFSSPAVFIVIKDASGIALGHWERNFRLWLCQIGSVAVLIVCRSLLIVSISRIILLISICTTVEFSSATISNILLDSHADSLYVSILLLPVQVNGFATSWAFNFLDKPRTEAYKMKDMAAV